MQRGRMTVEKYQQKRKSGEIKPFQKPAKDKFVTCEICYDGKVLGLNQMYSGGWQKRHSKLKPIKEHFAALILNANIPQLEYIELTVYHNTRFDIDNLAAMVKPFVDQLRANNVIPDDTKKFWDHLTIAYDPKVKKKQLLFIIKGKAKYDNLLGKA